MKINRDSLLFDTKKQEFNAYKNTLRRLINQAKYKYYSKQFDKNKRNGKKTWHTIDQALHKKTPKSTPDAIIIDNKLSTDRKEMADTFNTYFSTVCAPSETDNSNMPTHSVYLSNLTNTTFQFEEIDNRTVLQYINNMLAKTLVVFYVWSPDIFVLSFYQNLFSGIAYSIMSNKTLPYHTIAADTTTLVVIP